MMQEQLKDCSFQPKLTERSLLIAVFNQEKIFLFLTKLHEQEKYRRDDLPIEMKLIEDGKISQEIKERAKNIQTALELEQCTFVPQISEMYRDFDYYD